MPRFDEVTEKDLKRAVQLGLFEHFRSYGKYKSHVNHNSYRQACAGEGGKCFLVDKHTGLLGLISKGVGLVDYHEDGAASKCDFHQEMVMTPLLYGSDKYLNASLVPDDLVGKLEVWLALQARYHEDPDKPGKWDGKWKKCDRYVQKYVIVAKVTTPFDCVLLRRVNHSHLNTFEKLQEYEQKLKKYFENKYAKEVEKYKRKNTALTQSRECVRKQLQVTKRQGEDQKKMFQRKNKKMQGKYKNLQGENQNLQGENQNLQGKNQTLQGENQSLRGKNQGLEDYSRRLECQRNYGLSHVPTLQECDKWTNPSSSKAPPAKRSRH